MEPNYLDMDDSEFESAGAEFEGASSEASPATTESEVESDDDYEYNDDNYDDEDPESQLDKLYEPIQADGIDNFQIQNIDEAKQLIQQGLEYNSKMATIKPQRKLLKMLEKNDLLDEAKLSYLIDLASGNPDAITKLLIDKEVDPYELDTTDGSNYTPGNHMISDESIALDEVLESLRASPTHDKTMEMVTSKWDSSSREAIVKNPNVLRVIDMHMGNGVYDVVNSRIQRERAMGRLPSGSDFDLYMHYGEILMQEGALDEYMGNGKPTERVSAAPANARSVESQRRKAAPTRGGRTKTVKRKEPSASDFLNMSDAEFLKFSES